MRFAVLAKSISTICMLTFLSGCLVVHRTGNGTFGQLLSDPHRVFREVSEAKWRKIPFFVLENEAPHPIIVKLSGRDFKAETKEFHVNSAGIVESGSDVVKISPIIEGGSISIAEIARTSLDKAGEFTSFLTFCNVQEKEIECIKPTDIREVIEKTYTELQGKNRGSRSKELAGVLPALEEDVSEMYIVGATPKGHFYSFAQRLLKSASASEKFSVRF